MRFVRLMALATTLSLITTAARAWETPRPQPPGEPADQAFVEFVDELTETIGARDAEFFEQHVNAEEVVARALRGLGSHEAIAEGLVDGITGKTSVPQSIVHALGDKGTYLPLWVRNVNGTNRAMMRMLSSEGMLNYHELLLVQNDDGEVETVDVYVFATGETLSQTLRRGSLVLIAGQKDAAAAPLKKGEQAFLKHFNTVGAMNRAAREGDFQLVLTLYDSLPEELKSQKPQFLARINAARQVSDELYLAALDDFAKTFPHDPAGDLMLIDAYVMREDFDKCLATIDRLDKRVGGDPYLDFVRGNVFVLQGKTAEGKKLIESAIEGAPGVPQPYFSLVAITLDLKQFAQTVELLTTLENEMGMRFPDDVSQIELFKAFSQSPEHDAWQKQRKPAEEPDPADEPL